MIPFYSNSFDSSVSLQGKNQKALSVENICVKYPGENNDAIKNITLDIPIGLSVALIGANGSGKSTLLKTIAGQIEINSGEINIFGKSPKKSRNRISYLAQRSELDWSFPITVRKLVLTGCYAHIGWVFRPNRKYFALAEHLLKHLGLQDLSHKLIGELSGGQQQRLLIARSLMQNSDLLLLDEPFNAIDVESKEIIKQTIRDLRSSGKTIITATHDFNTLEKEFDQIIHLHNGIAIHNCDCNELSKDILLWNH